VHAQIWHSHFHTELTTTGREQGKYLNTILDGGGWWGRMTGNMSTRAIVSPLSRCLDTAMLVSKGLGISVGGYGDGE
jgi:broad specificity phosphatase PhoE